MNIGSQDNTSSIIPNSGPKLPRELIDHAASYLSLVDLLSFAQMGRLYHDMAMRHLYCTLDDMKTPRLIRCLRTLVDNDRLCGYVHTLELPFMRTIATGNLVMLLRRVLVRLRNLKNLTLAWRFIQRRPPIRFMLRQLPCQLHSFATNLELGHDLCAFLLSQPSLVRLDLRAMMGIKTTKLSEFSALAKAFPGLRELQVAHGGEFLEMLMRGRPVERLSISTTPFKTVDATFWCGLDSGSVPLRKLTHTSYETLDLVEVLEQVSTKAPMLEALHLIDVGLMGDSMSVPERLRASTPLLERFKHLRYLTFMAGSDSTDGDVEHEIAEAWAKACPSLQTIILPQGHVWFGRQNRWSACSSCEGEGKICCESKADG